ncbi:MAG: PilZ domain-containing protein [Ectothiorhodospiraceae bacterium]|jgi:hypothetical protein|nr:PilZ domain-containing protein [Ectothiorhodospiraceae bacterium]
MIRDYEEKRGFPRMQLDCPIEIVEPSGGQMHLGTARNLSADGALFHAPVAFAAGTVLTIQIVPEKTVVPPLRAEVEVVRVDQEPEGYLTAVALRRMLG